MGSDISDRLAEQPTGCNGDCTKCEVYPFCSGPKEMEIHNGESLDELEDW